MSSGLIGSMKAAGSRWIQPICWQIPRETLELLQQPPGLGVFDLVLNPVGVFRPTESPLVQIGWCDLGNVN